MLQYLFECKGGSLPPSDPLHGESFPLYASYCDGNELSHAGRSEEQGIVLMDHTLETSPGHNSAHTLRRKQRRYSKTCIKQSRLGQEKVVFE